jgi:dUTP pyrophosphatase
MFIKIIDYGIPSKWLPRRAHYNDCGADVFSPVNAIIEKNSVVKIPLMFGLELPDGCAGYIFPRSSLSAIGVMVESPPIDSGYRGEIHAILSNTGGAAYKIEKGDRIGQIVIMPVIIADFSTIPFDERGVGAFGSTGK